MKTLKHVPLRDGKGTKNSGFLRPIALSLCMFTFIGASAQTGKVSVNVENVSVKELFKTIEKQTPYRFSYRDIELQGKDGVSINVQNEELKQLLGRELTKQGLTYSVYKNKIIVTPVMQQEKGEKKTVKGQILDSNGVPVIGATVMVNGTTNGTVTDMDGNFSLEAAENAELVASFVGYQRKSFRAKGGKPMVITLKEDTELLDEVVVVGFGTQKKVNLTGAVASVSMDDAIGNRPINSATMALESTVPGLQINKVSGKPGSSINMNIRGVTSINGGAPLILVDNVPMDLDLVDPNDIESISVLKDAAASAIYGARAAFGVILVTTKQGKKETPIRVNYSNNFSFSKVASKLDLVTPRQNLEYFRDMGVQTYWSGQNLDSWFGYLDEYEKGQHPDGYVWGDDGYRYDLAATNPYDDMLDNFGFQQMHNVAVQGGSQKSSYRISLGATNENGILVTDKDKFTRYNASAFISMDATKWLTTQVDAKFSSSRMSTANGGTGMGNMWNISEFTSMSPLGYGTQTKDSEVLYPYATSRHAIELHDPDITRTRNLRLLGRVILKPLKDWTITGEYTFNWNWNANHKTAKHVVTLGPNDLGLKEMNKTTNYHMQNAFSDRNVINIFSNYTKKIKQHDFGVMAGFNQEEYHYEKLRGSRKDLIDQNLPSLGLAVGDMLAEDGFNELALRSLFYRVNYSFADRYLIEANGRYDGSSRFPKNDRFGFFPSFSAAWRISEEPFMDKVKDTFSNVKLRASWGNIGNQNTGGYYSYLPTIDTTRPKWVLPGTTDWVTSLTTPGLVSSSLTWEKVSTLDFGLDVSLWNKLNVTADYYIRDTKDMLGLSSPLPSVLGTAVPKTNVASLRTRGWELSVEWKDKIGEDFHYRVAANVYDSKSEITDYYNPTNLLFSGSDLVLRNGMQYGEIWGYETDRYLTEADFNADGTVKEGIVLVQGQKSVYPGDIIFVNKNGDDVISPGDSTEDNPGDMVVIGNRTPRYQFGLNLSASYKDFDVSMFFNGVGKRDMWLPLFPQNGQYVKGVETYQLDHWTPENPNAFYPRISEKTFTGTNYNRQSKYVVNGAYLRMKNLTLGYNVPKAWCSKFTLQSLRVFFSAENLFTLHHLPAGYMPDAYDTAVGGLSMASSASGDSYSGFYTYPLMRQFSFGINVSF